MVENSQPQDQILNENLLEKDTNFIYEVKHWKVLLPQLFAALVAVSFDFLVSICIAFSGILIPEIEKPDSGFNATISETSWIASSLSFTIICAVVPIGITVDKIGRLKVVRLSAIPAVIGWIIVATAVNTKMILIGRFISALGSVSCGHPAAIYLGELTWPNLRGTLLMLMSIASAAGVVFLYLNHLFLSWRTIAWCLAIYHLIAVLLTFCLHESPAWLVKNGKIKRARKSLEWLHKYQKKYSGMTNADIHLKKLIMEDKINRETIQNRNLKWRYVKLFFKQSAYKPTLILLGIFAIQHFSGNYVLQAYTITFFQSVGADMDPAISSNIMTAISLIVCIINLYSVNRFKRRTLLITSTLGVTVCLVISGIFTKLIQDGKSSLNWIPIVFLFVYTAMLSVGLGPLPWVNVCEMIPLEIRGALSSFIVGLSSCLMFAALYSYRYFDILLGCAGVQFLYASVAFVGSIFIYFLLPETKGKTLYEIESNFNK